MTLIISSNGVKNTESTEVKMGKAKINVLLKELSKLEEKHVKRSY